MKCLILNYLTINKGSAGSSRPGSAVVVPIIGVEYVVVVGGKQVTGCYKLKATLINDN